MTIEPDSIDFLLDTLRGEVGMRLNPAKGKSVTVPMSAETAEQIGTLLLAHARHIRR